MSSMDQWCVHVANTSEHGPSVVALAAKCAQSLATNPTLVSNRLIWSELKAQADFTG